MLQAVKLLAEYRGEDARECFTEKVGKDDHLFIGTPSHGYLCLGSDDNGYSEALEIARKSNFSYILDGGLVFLEEDCDASEFLNTYKGDK